MSTKVVNVKVNYIRPCYNNLKEWCEDRNNLYIGRRGIVFINNNGKKERYPKEDSKFANPFKVGRDGTLDDILIKYERHLRKELVDGIISKEDITNLSGKNLGCWCKPNPCHGDILLKYINMYTNDGDTSTYSSDEEIIIL